MVFLNLELFPFIQYQTTWPRETPVAFEVRSKPFKMVSVTKKIGLFIVGSAIRYLKW